jgi:hypothetical protein
MQDAYYYSLVARTQGQIFCLFYCAHTAQPAWLAIETFQIVSC